VIITDEERKELNRHPGKIEGPEPEDQREHFYRCKRCGQMVDKRLLGDVLHHEQALHAPIPANEGSGTLDS